MLDRKTLARQNVLSILKKRDMSLTDLAKLMGISPQYCWRLLKHDRGIGRVNEARIVAALNLPSIAVIYKDSVEDSEVLDVVIDKVAELEKSSPSKLTLVEKIIDLLQSAPDKIADHLTCQIKFLEQISK